MTRRLFLMLAAMPLTAMGQRVIRGMKRPRVETLAVGKESITITWR